MLRIAVTIPRLGWSSVVGTTVKNSRFETGSRPRANPPQRVRRQRQLDKTLVLVQGAFERLRAHHGYRQIACPTSPVFPRVGDLNHLPGFRGALGSPGFPMGSWKCRCGQDNWGDKQYCRSCGTPWSKGANVANRRTPSQGKRDHGQWKAGKGVEKGGGKGGAAKGGDPTPQPQLPAVLPAKPSEAKTHPSYLPVPRDPQEKDLHVRSLRNKLNGLNRLREVSWLAGKTGNGENTSEIAVLRHMLFAAENHEEMYATKTWGRVMELRMQLTTAIQKEREARSKVRELQEVLDHFSDIYEELREEQDARVRSPTPEGGGMEGQQAEGAAGMEGVAGAQPPQPHVGQQQQQPQYSQSSQFSPSAQQYHGTQSIGMAQAPPYPHPSGNGQWSTQQSHEGLSQDWGQQGWNTNAGWDVNSGDGAQQQSQQSQPGVEALHAQFQQLAMTVGTLMERLGPLHPGSAPQAAGHSWDGRDHGHMDASLDLAGAETNPPPPDLYGDGAPEAGDRGRSRSRGRDNQDAAVAAAAEAEPLP